MNVLAAEWLRFVRNRTNLGIALIAFVLLVASAIDAGTRATQLRERSVTREQQWSGRLRNLAVPNAQVEAASNATRVFEFGRTETPPLLRPMPGGLALAVRHFETLPADIGVTLESRYLDSRRNETIDSPLIGAMGAPDFSVVVALLVPLLLIGLSHGLIQDAREQGMWRLVRAQTSSPWRVLFSALFLRLAVAIVLVAIATAVAFALDVGSRWSDALSWLAAATLFATLWCALIGLLALPRMTAATATLALLSVWLVTTFAVPAVLVEAASRSDAPRSQLATLHTIRKIQHEVEANDRALLAAWYTAHPQHRPQTIAEHTFPVTYVPRYLAQDAQIVPLMRRFEQFRRERLERIEPYLAFAPGPALVLFADHLSGASARHQETYLQAIADAEVRWREVLIPRVMSYRGLDERDVSALAAIELEMQAVEDSDLLPWLAAVAILLSTLVFAGRRALLAP